MAVQAVYQMQMEREQPAALIINEYLSHRSGMEVDGEKMVPPDEKLFKNIVLGVNERLTDLDGIVQANRPQKPGQTPPNEPLLKSVLLCGSYELLAHQDIDYPIIISSYIDVAKGFFQGNEPGLVNGVLDSVRKVTRTA